MFYFKKIVKAAQASDGKKALDKLLSQEGVCIDEFGEGTTPAGKLAMLGDLESVKALINRGAMLRPILEGLVYAPDLRGKKYHENLNFAKALCKKFNIPNQFLIKSVVEGGHEDCLTQDEFKHDDCTKGRFLRQLRAMYSTAEEKDIPLMVLLATSAAGMKVASEETLGKQLIFDNQFKLFLHVDPESPSIEYLDESLFFMGMRRLRKNRGKKFFSSLDVDDLEMMIIKSATLGRWKISEYLLGFYKELNPDIANLMQKICNSACLYGHRSIVEMLHKKFNLQPKFGSENSEELREKFIGIYINNKVCFNHFLLIEDKILRSKIFDLTVIALTESKLKPEVRGETLKVKHIPHFLVTGVKAIKDLLPLYRQSLKQQIYLSHIKKRYNIDNRIVFSWVDPTVRLMVLQGTQLVRQNKISYDLYKHIVTFLTPLTSLEADQLLQRVFFQTNKSLIYLGLKKKIADLPFYKKNTPEYKIMLSIKKKIQDSKNLSELIQVINSGEKEVKTPQYKTFFSHGLHNRLGVDYIPSGMVKTLSK